jgi:predicted enzyme related to lactoylglutathione lyase
MTPAPIVFFDIAGPDLGVQRAFYRDVFGWESAPTGHVTASVPSGPLPGFLRTDPAAVVFYFGVPDVTTTLAKIAATGGVIAVPRFEVPGVVVLGLFNDPAGNRLGLVEMNGDTPRIP